MYVPRSRYYRFSLWEAQGFVYHIVKNTREKICQKISVLFGGGSVAVERGGVSNERECRGGGGSAN